MLKRIFKLTMASFLIFGFSAIASAEINLSGDISEYTGQYNSGVSGESAYLQSIGEAHLRARYSEDKVSANFEIEFRDDMYGNGDNQSYFQRSLTYQATDDLSVTMGTVVNLNGLCYAIDSGIGNTRAFPFYADFLCLPAVTEADGVQATYNLAPIKGRVQIAILPNTDGGQLGVYKHAAQTMAAGIGGSPTDMISFKVGYKSTTFDDATTSADESRTDSSNNIGVKAKFGGDMSVSLDVTSQATAKNTATNTAETATAMNIIQFRKQELGPGGLIATVGTREYKVGGEKSSSNTYTDLVYQIPVSKTTHFDVFYISNANKVESSGDTTTATYLGAGFAARF